MSKKIVIIGSGFGALSAACLLAKSGYKVSVYEKNEQPGGRASVLRQSGFTFDMGPSWFMMPDVFDRFFGEFGKKTTDLLELVHLDPEYRVVFEDGQKIDVPASANKARALFESMEPGAGKKFDEYLQDSQMKYDLAIKSVLYKNVDNLLGMLSPDIIKCGSNLDVFLPIHRLITKYFQNPKIQQILEYNLVFLGCSPDNAPALFSMMAHVDFNLGIYYPMGGMGKVVEAIVKIATDLGVEFHYNSPVEQIITEGDQVVGIRVAGKLIKADVVVSNADLKFTEDILSDQSKRQYSDKYWNKKTLTPSAFLLYLGIKGEVDISHHTLYFGNDWKPHFRDIFDNPAWPVAPSLYINNPSVTDSGLAPKGHQALMVLVPVAAGLPDSADWNKHYGDYIIDYIDTNMKLSLKDKIVFRTQFSVSDFASRYNSYQGNALGGLAHTLLQSAVWRPSNKNSQLKNLFFAGANTVPGIGVPPAIISGHLVEDRVRKYLGDTA